MYDWTAEKRELRDKTVADQRMGCSCREAEKFLTAALADVLKSGYETFERPGFERGTCCELLRCRKVV